MHFPERMLRVSRAFVFGASENGTLGVSETPGRRLKNCASDPTGAKSRGCTFSCSQTRFRVGSSEPSKHEPFGPNGGPGARKKSERHLGGPSGCPRGAKRVRHVDHLARAVRPPCATQMRRPRRRGALLGKTEPRSAERTHGPYVSLVVCVCV